MPFDEAKAERAVEFMGLLKQYQGDFAGKPLALMDWQKDVVRKLFGTVREDGTRQYREVFIFLPRGNGKSTFVSALALYLLFADGEKGAEIYCGASDREQASIVFDTAAAMVRQDDALSSMANVIDYRKRIEYEDSTFRAIPSDAGGSHGLRPSVVILDELHAITNEEFVNALITATAKKTRKQPLIVYITTAGVYDPESVCWKKYQYAKSVEAGEFDDPAFLPVIFEADKDADFRDEGAWEQANPSLDVTVDRETLAREAQKAERSIAYQNTVRRLYLNQWVEQSDRWLDMDVWERCDFGETPASELLHRPCYAAFDLSTTTDLTALALLFAPTDAEERYEALMHFWLPEKRVREATEAPYLAWAQEGHLDVLDGRSVDYDHVRATINEYGEKFSIQEIAFDPWNATQTAIQLERDDGFRMVQVRQGYKSFNEPCKELERLLVEERLNHAGNPVLRWMAANVAVKQDPAGNIKPDKSATNGRIDGIVALVMALGRATLHEGDQRPSKYETEDLLVL